MPSFVAIKGSGIGTTIVEAATGSGLTVSDSSRIGYLSVTAHLTSGTYLIASNSSSRSFSIPDVELTGQGSNSTASGFAGIQVTSGTAYLDRVRIRVTNPAGTSTGILVSGSSAVLHASHLDIQIAAQTPQGLVLR